MRALLSALTLRGRAFLAAGGTALVCSVLLTQPALARVGALAIALPLLSMLLLARSRHRLALTRTLTPAVVTAGQSALVELHLRNEGRRNSGRLRLEEALPYTLGSRPRFVLPGLAGGAGRVLSYHLRPDLRGHYPIGPLGVRAGDPFGMVETRRAFQTANPLVVTPRTVPLPTVTLSGAWTGAGENRPRAFATGSAEDVTVREYRTGDDLRRVHWRSTARTGDLMVRREERPWQSRATILLDNRTQAHRGQGAASSFEAAVTAAASVALHLHERGYGLRLVTATGAEAGGRWHELGGRAGMNLLLEELAVIDLVDQPRLDTGWVGNHTSSGLLLGVLGAVDGADRSALSRMRSHASLGLAIALEVDGWAGHGDRPGTAASDPGRLLRSLGWRASALEARGSLVAAWQALGRSSTAAEGSTR